MKKVQILLSTYNGEKYINEQLDSLLTQNYKNLSILVRDDGSKDSTVSILRSYKNKYPQISIIEGENKGVIASFFELALQASEEAEYFAFCDQDDFWKPSKLSRAISLLEKEDPITPLIYFSRLDIVDDNLNLLRPSQVPPRELGFKNALIQNVATGCTIVFNKKLLELFKGNLPAIEKVTMHDGWFYLLGSAFGRIIYDDESHILYRQHASNTLGMADNKIKSALVRYRNFKKSGMEKPFTKQVQEFYRLFEDQLTNENKKLVEDFLNKRETFTGRVNYSLNSPLYRQNTRDTILFKFLYFMKNY